MKNKLVDIRCACGKLLGRVQEGAAHEHKCARCKGMTQYPERPTPKFVPGEIRLTLGTIADIDEKLGIKD